MRRKREALLERGAGDDELESLEADLARVNLELRHQRGQVAETPVRTAFAEKSAEPCHRCSPRSQGSTATPGTGKATMTPSPMPVGTSPALRSSSENEPAEESPTVVARPPERLLAADSGDAVLMGSARMSVAAVQEGKENVQPSERNEVAVDADADAVTPRQSPEVKAMLHVMASPSPPCARAASTPGRRAASSFGSSGLFRETPSPRTSSKAGRDVSSPAPALQPKSLFLSPSPPRYAGSSFEGFLRPVPPVPGSTAVPAWPAAPAKSPVKCLPPKVPVQMSRSPSAPSLGSKASSHATGHRHELKARGDGSTPRNLTDFRKSLELALLREKGAADDPEKSKSHRKPVPWR